jgi:hypothetical protein
MTHRQIKARIRSSPAPIDGDALDRNVNALIDLIRSTDMASLLHIAFWRNIVLLTDMHSDKGIRRQDMAAAALAYIVNLHASAPERLTSEVMDAESAYAKILPLVERIRYDIDRYCLRESPLSKQGAQPTSDALELVYSMALLDWVHFKRSRYAHHDAQFLRLFLTLHEDALKQAFDVSVDDIVTTVDAIVRAQLFGSEILIGRFLAEHRQQRESRPERVSEETIARVCDSATFREMCFNAAGHRFIDVDALLELPQRFLDALSFAPGEETRLLSPGLFRGLPLRLTPLRRRPFVKVGDRHFCTHADVLATTIYRALYDRLKALAPDCFNEVSWNITQSFVFELFVSQWFAKRLPGARIYGPYFYPGGTPAFEGDILVQYSDQLFVIECKAGHFAYMPPALDFSKYIDSLQKLVGEPFDQCMRFKRYLESAAEIVIYKDRALTSELARLRRADFRTITQIGAMADSFPGPAVRDASLRALNADAGRHRFISLAIEDLLIYGEQLQSPTIFLDFIEQRGLAAANPHLVVMDELDHLGLYLRNVRYASQAASALSAGNGAFVRDGTALLDRYYGEWYERRMRMGVAGAGPLGKAPLPWNIPPQLEEVIAILDGHTSSDRSRVTSGILDLPSHIRDGLGRSLAATIQRLRTDPSVIQMDTHPHRALLVMCAAHGTQFSEAELHYNAKVLALFARADSLALFLTYTTEGRLSAVRWQFGQLSSISPDEEPALRRSARVWGDQRLAAYRASRGAKIGRNVPCPCKSGKKFKHCHGAASDLAL